MVILLAGLQNVGGAQSEKEGERVVLTVLKHGIPSEKLFWSAYVEIRDGTTCNVDVFPYGSKRKHCVRLNDNLSFVAVEGRGYGLKEGITSVSVGLTQERNGEFLLEKGRPSHGMWGDNIRSHDFRNEDNTDYVTQDDIQPFWGDQSARYFEYEDYTMELRIISYEMINLGKGKVPAFRFLSFFGYRQTKG